MPYVFLVVFFICIVGLFKPFKGLKRKHFTIGALGSFLMIGVTAPAPEAASPNAPSATMSPAEMQALEKKNAAAISRLKEEAVTLPATDLDGNLSAYKKLAELAPANAAFREKLAEYEQKVGARGRYADHPETALSLGKVSWSADGFGSVMMINSVTVSNDAPFDVKDFALECRHFAPSGTEIDSNKRTVFEIVPANGSKTINRFNMGFIASQAESTSCEVTSAKKA